VAIVLTSKGEFNNITKYLNKVRSLHIEKVLDSYGKKGVEALSAATPVDTGLTAASWGYSIQTGPAGASITFTNSNVNKGVNIAIILQYGHGTGTGGWVEGRDYINPAIQPIFDELVEKVWKEVTSV
jgi:hypothetical protein